MKVFLIQAYLGRSEKPIYPLGLAYLGASLKDYDVQALDPNVCSDPYGEIARRIKAFVPDIVGISLRNIDTTQYRDPYLYYQTLQPTLNIIKEQAPQARRIIGGSGFSIYAEALMKRFPDLDYGVLLEAETTFPQLLANLDHPEVVPGVYYRSQGQVQLSSPPQLPDFDSLPSPKWDTVDIKPYIGLLETIGVQAKRGCGLRCAYCTYCFLNGSYYRLRKPESIAAEIIDLRDRFKVDHFMFVDSVFNVPPSHAVAICEEIIRQKVQLPWSAWYNERVFNEDMFKLAREAGCQSFSFSPDAFTDRSLELLQKNLRVKDILKVYDIAQAQEGARFGFNFFVNPPGQTYSGFIKLMGFWLKARLALRGKLYGFGMGNIRVEPDTEICRRALTDGILTEGTNLLPETSAELLKLFYTNPKTPLINQAFKLYGFLAALKHRLRP